MNCSECGAPCRLDDIDGIMDWFCTKCDWSTLLKED